ncbi:diacylglycerol kinase [Gelria sp. Kuro-4]|uniref:diacylglycerol kinase n=1 Tax=Gelria sp. Kuro-4 TaxID=2796927 RepID=UPI001BEF372B|nr:diacylglycerol kinase [Gelria sp. Kuro-4]MDI3523034.1 diacylglycerol kinase [Bacillota bacterium]MDK2927099.1 diacylglycerol kinase [Bacillota bacterium]BCV25634.1 diacylglycerol kinase [Gelria sp. Kuro-4]
MARRAFRESLRYAWAGLAWTWRTQGNLRRHTLAAAAALAVAAWLKVPPGQQALVVLTIALVVVSELINTAVEATVDLCRRSYHPLAGRAKDVAAAAVLVAALAAVVVGLIVFGPPLMRLLF